MASWFSQALLSSGTGLLVPGYKALWVTHRAPGSLSHVIWFPVICTQGYAHRATSPFGLQGDYLATSAEAVLCRLYA
jgi:hypothetical protein